MQLGTASVDNFYVRSLLGADVFHAPAASLTRAHLGEAAARLARFDVVLVLEEMDAGWPQLERLAGWPCVPTYDDSHRSFGKGDESVKFSRAQHDALVDANALDLTLYGFALNLSRAITAALPPPGPAPSARRLAKCQHVKPKGAGARRRRLLQGVSREGRGAAPQSPKYTQ